MNHKHNEAARRRNYRENPHGMPVWVHVFSPYMMYSRLVPFCNADGYAHEDCRAELRKALAEGGILKVRALALEV